MDKELQDIREKLAELAKCVDGNHEQALERWIANGIRSCLSRLKAFIPGLEPATEHELNNEEISLEMIDIHLMHESYRNALRLTLDGLSRLPHHPRLWYRAAEAMMHLRATQVALEALDHSLWINPGQEDADLDRGIWSAKLNDQHPYGPLH